MVQWRARDWLKVESMSNPQDQQQQYQILPLDPAQYTVSQLCADFIHSPAGQEMMQKQVAATCERAIGDAMRRGPFRDELDALVFNVLKLPKHIDIASYNEMIVGIVRQQIQAIEHKLIKNVGERLVDLLEVPPDTIKLSELCQMYLDYLKPEEDDDCVCFGRDDEKIATILWCPDKSNSYGSSAFNYLELSDKPKRKRHEGDIQIGFHCNEMFSLKFQNVATEQHLFTGPHTGFEQTLFQMKAHKTTVILDPEKLDDLDLNYAPDRD